MHACLLHIHISGQVVDYEKELKVMQNVSKEEYLACIRR
jgi:hypothetical protein